MTRTCLDVYTRVRKHVQRVTCSSPYGGANTYTSESDTSDVFGNTSDRRPDRRPPIRRTPEVAMPNWPAAPNPCPMHPESRGQLVLCPGQDLVGGQGLGLRTRINSNEHEELNEVSQPGDGETPPGAPRQRPASSADLSDLDNVSLRAHTAALALEWRHGVPGPRDGAAVEIEVSLINAYDALARRTAHEPTRPEPTRQSPRPAPPLPLRWQGGRVLRAQFNARALGRRGR
jgi:hypothetical protein